jgi:hypothetical protein
MNDQTSDGSHASISRRTILKAAGGLALIGTVPGVGAADAQDPGDGGAFASTAAADGHLIDVDPTTIELEDCDEATDTFTVTIRGPSFGRTDVTVKSDEVDVSPDEFRLESRGASETVTVGPGSGVATVRATTPNGDKQTVDVTVTCPEDEVTVSHAGRDYDAGSPRCVLWFYNTCDEAATVTFTRVGGTPLSDPTDLTVPAGGSARTTIEPVTEYVWEATGDDTGTVHGEGTVTCTSP